MVEGAGRFFLFSLSFHVAGGGCGRCGKREAFSKSCGKVRSSFPQDVSFHSPVLCRRHYGCPFFRQVASLRSTVATRSWQKKTSQMPSSAVGRKATCSPMNALLM